MKETPYHQVGETNESVCNPSVLELNGLADRPEKSQRWWSLNGWKPGVSLGLSAAALVLVINVVILAWINAKYGFDGGSAAIFSGTFDEMKRISTWSHLAVNIVSTVLLAASNNCMQCLMAPTRAEIDSAHRKKQWLQIGLPGMRNLFRVSKGRSVIWIVLLITSFPIHLLYNSVIFDTIGSNDYIMALVAPDFLTGGGWDYNWWSDWLSAYGSDLHFLYDYQKSPNGLVRLEKDACISAYAQSFVSTWRNVLVVTTEPAGTNNTIYDIKAVQYEVTTLSQIPASWYCGQSLAQQTTCTLSAALAQASNWTMESVNLNTTTHLSRIGSVTVDYCLAEPAAAPCSVSISSSILIAVIVCNVIKIFCFAITLRYSFVSSAPLMTTGDAVESFLNDPDQATIGNSVLSAADVRSGRWKKNKASPVWHRKRHFWFAAASVKRWLILSVLVIITWAGGLVLLIIGIHDLPGTQGIARVSTAELDFIQFGTPGPLNTIVYIGTQRQQLNSLLTNVILANTPQVLLSAMYFMYNGVFTCMLAMQEWSLFAIKRKGLRVSTPRGSQRSTMYLQLPYMYSIPMLVSGGLLHWFLSQSLFLARVSFRGLEQYDLQPGSGLIDALGWSPIGLICTLVTGFTMMAIIWSMGLRRFREDMPLSAGCSVSISAACHPAPGEVDNLVEQPLLFGDLSYWSSRHSAGSNHPHASFTARDTVETLVEGELYS